jgi:hypothetical protein
MAVAGKWRKLQYEELFSVTDDRLIGWYALAFVLLTFLGLGINITLTHLQALSMYPLVWLVVKIWPRWAVKWFTPCCNHAVQVLSVSTDLNALIIYLNGDWSVAVLDSSQSSLCAANVLRFGCPCPSKVTSTPADRIKWTLLVPSGCVFQMVYIGHQVV